MPITFGDPTNYRTNTLTFEVVGFHETYHAILPPMVGVRHNL